MLLLERLTLGLCLFSTPFRHHMRCCKSEGRAGCRCISSLCWNLQCMSAPLGLYLAGPDLSSYLLRQIRRNEESGCAMWLYSVADIGKSSRADVIAAPCGFHMAAHGHPLSHAARPTNHSTFKVNAIRLMRLTMACGHIHEHGRVGQPHNPPLCELDRCVTHFTNTRSYFSRSRCLGCLPFMTHTDTHANIVKGPS
jgi:hypothetical protein